MYLNDSECIISSFSQLFFRNARSVSPFPSILFPSRRQIQHHYVCFCMSLLFFSVVLKTQNFTGDASCFRGGLLVRRPATTDRRARPRRSRTARAQTFGAGGRLLRSRRGVRALRRPRRRRRLPLRRGIRALRRPVPPAFTPTICSSVQRAVQRERIAYSLFTFFSDLFEALSRKKRKRTGCVGKEGVVRESALSER